jgi:hypothetical protein
MPRLDFGVKCGKREVGRKGSIFRQPSAELLSQCNEYALGAADVTEPIAILVLLQLANEFGTVSA